MSTTTTVTREERDRFVAQAHTRAVRTATQSLAWGAVVIGLGFWAVYLVVVVAVPLIVNAAGGVMGGGVMTGAVYSARWFALTLGAITFMIVATTHLAAGGTRRSLHLGAVRATLITGACYGVVNVLALLIERQLFGALGWPWHSPEPAAVDAGGFVLTGVAQLLVVAVYALVGIAVAVGYQSFGVWRGTLLVVPGVVLLGLVEAATGSGGVGDVIRAHLPGAEIPVAVRLLASALVLALTALWLRWQLLNLRLRPSR